MIDLSAADRGKPRAVSMIDIISSDFIATAEVPFSLMFISVSNMLIFVSESADNFSVSPPNCLMIG